MKMMKALFYAVSVMIAFTGCNSIDLQTEEPNAPQEWKVSIQATKGDASGQTKALSESGSTITASWEAGDVVYICNTDYNYGVLTAQSSGTSTLLTGSISKTPTVGKQYTLRYLQKGENYLYLPNQKGSLADIAKNHDMAEATVTVKSINGNEVTFEETSVQFESKISITKFTFNRSIKDVTVFCSNLKTYVRPNYTANYGFVNVNPDEATSTVYVAMSTLEDKKAVFLFLAKGEDGLYYIAAKKAQLENGKNYAATVALTAMPDRVDLGIVRDEKPTYWATKNLGANRPGEVGNYYAWGETSPKTTYSWDNYAWGKYCAVTKYNPDRSDQGTVDGRAYLLPEDDAATAALGEGWRMPSYDDFNDLLNKSNVEQLLSFADGIWGYCFHSVVEGYEGKFIFIPMTNGYYKDDVLTSTLAWPDKFNGGAYWSNKIDQVSWTSASFANTLKFSNSIYSSPETSMMDRAYGLAVRPVYVH
jgi:hypothetical protein